MRPTTAQQPSNNHQQPLFKALESSVADGSWAVAKGLEIAPDQAVGLTTTDEKRLAAREQLLRMKLKDAEKRVGSRGDRV